MLLIHISQSQPENILTIVNCGSGREVTVKDQKVKKKETVTKVILSKKTFLFGVPDGFGFCYGDSCSMKPSRALAEMGKLLTEQVNGVDVQYLWGRQLE